jgi:hypothetical protein
LKKIFNLLLLCLIPISACVKNIEPEIEDSTVDCSILETYYTDHVATILSSKCTGCHSGPTPAFGLDISTYSLVKTNLSKILNRVNRNSGDAELMPQGGPKLSVANLDTLYSFSKMECDE